jgi:tetratricopeptide (TPR) repeat protein
MSLSGHILPGIVTPEMVSAIGGLWILALIVLGIILLIIFRKPLARLATLIYDKIEGAQSAGLKAGPVEVSLTTVAREAAKEAIAEEAAKKEEGKVEDAKTPPMKTEPARADPPTPPNLMNLLDAMHERDRPRVESIYTAIQEAAGQNDAEIQRNEAIYLYAIFRLGDVSALGRLEQLAISDNSVADVSWWLGACYQDSHELVRAADTFKRAADKQTKPVARAKNLISSAECLFELKRDQDAYELLSDELKVVTDTRALFELYSAFASFYQKRDNREMQALALEKAVEYVPNDTATMFNAAYAYAEAGYERLSLFHYRNILQFNPKEASALNNLGVQYDRLSMPMFSVNAYKEAAAADSTLASANLAYKYMNAGFADDAETLLDKAKQVEEVHPNVLSALASLTERNERESKTREEIMTESAPQQEFLRAYAAAFFISDGPDEFTGRWRYPSGAEINIDVSNGAIASDWDIGGKKYRFDGTVHHRAAKLTMHRMNYAWLSPDLEMGFEKESDAFAYVIDGERIEMMKLKDGKHEFETLVRSKIDAASENPDVLPLPID